MAVLAVFLLVAATAASIGGTVNNPGDADPTLAGMGNDNAPATTVRSAKANKGFKVSLYLFRRN